MSFFTNNAYASFHQHLPPKMNGLQSDSRVVSPSSSGTPVSKKLSPQKLASSKSSYDNAFTGDRALDNSSFLSTSSSASTASEYDPLSPLHSTRATDPWLGDSHMGITPTSAATTSLKVYDQIDDDEEWGEFMNFSHSKGHAQELQEDVSVKEHITTHTASVPSIRSTRRANRAAKSNCAYDGWQRIPQARSERESSCDDIDDDQEKLNEPAPRTMYSALPYNHQQSQHFRSDFVAQRTGSSVNPERLQGSSSVLDSLANAVMTRLASFRSNSKPPRLATSSWSTRLFSGENDVTTAAAMPARGYDSYGVTFERGPIGLELETDWYGRQAVVKGFKTMQDGQDGLARQCGVIRIGDVLTAIDGESCLEMSFQETLTKLRVVSARRHVLHFKSLEAAGDLSVYNSDMDIIQAKRFIHQHKERFYRQPRRVVTSENVNPGHRGLIIGCVERLRGESVTAFNFHREDTGEFVLACSCVNEGTGMFIFHTLQDSHLRDFKALPQSEDSAVYLGQMVPNFLGTEFTVLDHQQKRRNELGYLVYSSNVLGRVPNFLKCVFPRQPVAVEDEAESDSEESCAREDGVDGDEKQSKLETSAAPQPRPRAATTGSYGVGSSVPLSQRDTMMNRNGSIAERYMHVKQQRQLSLVERLRHFSLDDLDMSLDYAGDNVEALWHDADDHESRGRSMRMTPGRCSGSRSVSMRGLTGTPYGALEQTEYHCDLLTFETKKPAWNDELGAWTLNFHGRVKVASKKNFLLVPEQGNDAMETEFGEERVFLRFGKVSKSRFSLDYQAPISPLLALAIVCSSFAHKIAVT